MQPNLSQIQEIAAGDDSLTDRLIAILKKEFPQERDQFINLIQNNNFHDAAALVHKIKHKIILLGMDKSYNIAINFENELKNGKMTLFSKFVLILDKIDQFLKTT